MNNNCITDSIKYIGVNDKTLDLSESQYKIPNGVSYNSYVILDEKIAVMDTVDKRALDEWLNNLDVVLEGKQPDYLIISHLEPDHAANIQILSEKYSDMKLVGNKKIFDMLPQFFDFDISERKVIVNHSERSELVRPGGDEHIVHRHAVRLRGELLAHLDYDLSTRGNRQFVASPREHSNVT